MKKLFRIRNMLLIGLLVSVVGVAVSYAKNAELKKQPDYTGPAPMVVIMETGKQTVSSINQLVQGVQHQYAQQQEITCLARNIYFEARGESTAGKLAVGMVTINRVESNNFPDTICKVVYQSLTNSNGDPRLNRCQFSWYCDGKVDKIRNDDAYKKIYALATDLYVNYYKHQNIPDIVGGATFYHNMEVSPHWRNTAMTTRIDNHIFYRMRDVGNTKDNAVASSN